MELCGEGEGMLTKETTPEAESTPPETPAPPREPPEGEGSGMPDPGGLY